MVASCFFPNCFSFNEVEDQVVRRQRPAHHQEYLLRHLCASHLAKHWKKKNYAGGENHSPHRVRKKCHFGLGTLKFLH